MIVFVIVIASTLAGVCKYAAHEQADSVMNIYDIIADMMLILIGFYLGLVW